jgi:hypothetical protein
LCFLECKFLGSRFHMSSVGACASFFFLHHDHRCKWFSPVPEITSSQSSFVKLDVSCNK